jgi:hypothetical protein
MCLLVCICNSLPEIYFQTILNNIFFINKYINKYIILYYIMSEKSPLKLKWKDDTNLIEVYDSQNHIYRNHQPDRVKIDWDEGFDSKIENLPSSKLKQQEHYRKILNNLGIKTKKQLKELKKFTKKTEEEEIEKEIERNKKKLKEMKKRREETEELLNNLTKTVANMKKKKTTCCEGCQQMGGTLFKKKYNKFKTRKYSRNRKKKSRKK